MNRMSKFQNDQGRIDAFLRENDDMTADCLAANLEIPKYRVMKALKELKALGKVEMLRLSWGTAYERKNQGIWKSEADRATRALQKAGVAVGYQERAVDDYTVKVAIKYHVWGSQGGQAIEVDAVPFELCTYIRQWIQYHVSKRIVAWDDLPKSGYRKITAENREFMGRELKRCQDQGFDHLATAIEDAIQEYDASQAGPDLPEVIEGDDGPDLSMDDLKTHRYREDMNNLFDTEFLAKREKKGHHPYPDQITLRRIKGDDKSLTAGYVLEWHLGVEDYDVAVYHHFTKDESAKAFAYYAWI